MDAGNSQVGIETLAERIMAHDEAAITEFADRLAPKLLGFYINRGLNKAAAEEAAADCLYAVVSALCRGQYRRLPGACFEAFLFTIARNTLVDRRKKVSKYHCERPFDEAKKTLPDALEPNMEIVHAIGDAMMFLSDKDEEIISLRHFQEYDLSFKEIANRLGIRETNARVRWLRAIRKLRSMLEADPRIQRVLKRNVGRSGQTYEHTKRK